ncbi:MAG: hypothetical protein CL912_22260 [Deltaproteobacteria bacterium]|nr:hypothetical protein [Deltaproteobacteria bacterium]
MLKILYILFLLILIAGCEKNDADPLSDSITDTSSEINTAQAFRILEQATFGPTNDEVKEVQALGTAKWIEQQLNSSSAYDSSTDSHQSHLQRYKAIAKMAEPSTYESDQDFNNNFHGRTSDYQTAAWFENALHGKDQLRQRVALAFSELLVISGSKQRTRFRGDSLASYYDILAKNAFGNFRILMGEVSRSTGMGIFLSHQGNKKHNSSSNTHPDENFARELMQLFSIGLWKMNQDGSMVKDSSGNPITSYTQDDVEELAKVMTGYDIKGNSKFGKTSRANGEEWSSPMEFNSSHHEYASKTFLGSTIGTEGSSNSEPSDLDQALDIIFQHQNVGPHVGRHLITRLVTSNPSSAYISRVAEKFNNDGNGTRGNLKEVVKAVLLDVEARETKYSNNGNYGKPKEPLLALTQFLRAFDVKPLDGWKSRMNATMNGVYQFFYLENIIGQSPLRSETVFNFFSADFVPADSHFISNSMVAPEFQIQSDTVLIKFHNLIRSSLNTNEKNAILENNASLKDFASARSYTKQNYYINIDSELQIFEYALDGDTNGDFNNINDSEKKKAAIQTLLQHLDEKLMGGEMPSDYYTALTTHLMNMNWGKNFNAKEARNVISDAIRFMVISSFFMIQK